MGPRAPRYIPNTPSAPAIRSGTSRPGPGFYTEGQPRGGQPRRRVAQRFEPVLEVCVQHVARALDPRFAFSGVVPPGGRGSRLEQFLKRTLLGVHDKMSKKQCNKSRMMFRLASCARDVRFDARCSRHAPIPNCGHESRILSMVFSVHILVWNDHSH